MDRKQKGFADIMKAGGIFSMLKKCASFFITLAANSASQFPVKVAHKPMPGA